MKGTRVQRPKNPEPRYYQGCSRAMDWPAGRVRMDGFNNSRVALEGVRNLTGRVGSGRVVSCRVVSGRVWLRCFQIPRVVWGHPDQTGPVRRDPTREKPGVRIIVSSHSLGRACSSPRVMMLRACRIYISLHCTSDTFAAVPVTRGELFARCCTRKIIVSFFRHLSSVSLLTLMMTAATGLSSWQPQFMYKIERSRQGIWGLWSGNVSYYIWKACLIRGYARV